jgi:hypothetical protein
MFSLDQFHFNKSAFGEELIGKKSSENHFDDLISSSAFVRLEGKPPVLYLDLDLPVFDELWNPLNDLSFPRSTRKTLGENNKSILFGGMSKSINRNYFCNFGAVASHDSVLHRLLSTKYSTILNRMMITAAGGWQNVNESLFKKSKIHEDYRLSESTWTSGIINKNSQQNYHFDDMNIKNMMSAMITLKHNVAGGYLTFPEYKVAFEVKNRSVIFFCGSNILHGVSPISQLRDGKRYTVVYYTTEGLKHCDSYRDEIIKSTTR